MKSRRPIGSPIILVFGMLLAGGAAAQARDGEKGYPSRPVRMIVPFSPGGSSDLVARVMAQQLTNAWGQQVIVDNRPGAGGMLGHQLGSRASPDGYTITLTSIGPLAVNPTLYKDPGYDPLKSFATVTLTVSLLNAIVVHPSVPARNIAELIDHAKTHQVSFGSSGIGGAGHLAGELFNLMAGVKLAHVPYKGGAPAMIDLVGGRIQMICATLVTALPSMKSGKIRALAVTMKERAAVVPDLPTVSESGLPGFEANNWDGMLLPAGTPRAIVAKLSQDTGRALNVPEAKELLSSVGALPTPGTPEVFLQYLKSEIAMWRDVVQLAGIRAE